MTGTEMQTTDPDGCRHCGVWRRGHGIRWGMGIGWHRWITPTEYQRLLRIKARQESAPKENVMELYVVIGTSPLHDTSVSVGPFRSMNRALSASEKLDGQGYVTEIVPLLNISEVVDTSTTNKPRMGP